MIESGRRVAALVVCLGLSVMSGLGLRAAGNPQPASAPQVMALIISQEPEGEVFRELISEAVKYRLKRQGLEGNVLAGTSQGSAEQETAGLLERAREANAAAALVCSYSGAPTQMAISLKWYDVHEGILAAAVEKKGRVDLELDTLILEALDALFEQVQGRIAELAAEGQEALTAAQEPAAELLATAQPLPDSSAPRGGELTLEKPQAEPRRAPRFLLSTGFAPFIATGAASYYFRLGYLPSLMGSLLIAVPSGEIGIGVYLGMTVFSARGTQETARNFLIPLAFDLRYVLGGGSPVGLLLRLAGGAAMLVMRMETQGTLSKVLPFLKSGVGVELLFARRLGFGIEAGYEVYFEMPYLIMGFSPSLNASLRL